MIPTYRLYAIMYVDNMIITNSNSHSLKVDEFIKLLHVKFSLKDMGVLHYSWVSRYPPFPTSISCLIS